jgi:hypothetical protein
MLLLLPPSHFSAHQVDGVSVIGASADWFTDSILGSPGVHPVICLLRACDTMHKAAMWR